MAFNVCGCGSDQFEQWLFLGLSVESFNLNVNGLNAGAELSVTLVEDTEPTCAGRHKYYLDSDLQTQQWDLADPGWFGDSIDLIGRPVLFKHGDFEFAGFIINSSYTQNPGTTYTVKISSPFDLLSKVNVLTSSYAGATNTVPNLINAYGLYENADCSTFGNSGNYGQGMPWNYVREAIHALSGKINNAGLINLGLYLKDNRIQFIPGTNDGYGIIPEDDTGYILDLNELPSAPSRFLIDSNTTNLIEMINYVTEAAGMEYYTELIPVTYSGNVYKIIKIRVIDRTGTLYSGAIDEYLTGCIAECGYTEKTMNTEFRDAPYTNFVTGPNKQQLYIAWGDSGESVYDEVAYYDPILKLNVNVKTTTFDLSEVYVVPYWGLDTNGNVIKTEAVEWVIPHTTCVACDDRAVYEWDGAAWNLLQACDPNCSAMSPADPGTFNGERAYFWCTPDDPCDTNAQYQWDATINNGAGAWLRITSCPAGFRDTFKYQAGNHGEIRDAPCLSNFRGSQFTIPDGSTWQFYANLSALNEQTTLLDITAPVLINQLELVAALQGQSEWEDFVRHTKSATSILLDAINSYSGFSPRTVQNLGAAWLGLPDAYKAIIKPYHHFLARNLKNPALDWEDEEKKLLYDAVRNIADNYYGLKFAVRVPQLCYVADVDTLEIDYNYSVASGAWPESGGVENINVLGLYLYSDYINFFKNEDGTIGAFVRFDGADQLGSDNLKSEDYFYVNGDNGHMWVRCEVETDFVFGNYATRTDPYVVITLPGKVAYDLWGDSARYPYNPNNLYNNQAMWFWPTARGYNELWSAVNKFGAGGTFYGEDPISWNFYAIPNAVAIPLTNNQEVYGPWYSLASGPGATEYIADPDLTPWNQGSVANMNTLGQAVADFGIIDMYKNTGGSITVPGLPSVRVGEEILTCSNSPYIAGQRYAGTRTATLTASSTFSGVDYLVSNLMTQIWSGTLGPIVTSVSTSFSSSSITTSYNFDLYTKGYRRFSKFKLDSAKQFTELRRKLIAERTRRK